MNAITKLEGAFPSAREAMTALGKLEAEVNDAKSFAALRVMIATAAAVQREFKKVRDVSARAGGVQVSAAIRLDQELTKIPKATGTRGQVVGRKPGSGGKAKAGLSGGTVLEPPDKTAPTLAELGVDKKVASQAHGLAKIPKAKIDKIISDLAANGKVIAPSTVLAAHRKANRQEKIHAVSKAAFSKDGPFGTVVIDPPWPMQKIDRDERPNQDVFDYPTMTEAEIETFWKHDVADRLEPDCHLFMWTTQKWLPIALRLIEAAGFHYVLTMVWHKVGGFQPQGLPQYNCEFIVYARQGSPVFIDTKDFMCCFEAPRREHSRKPDKFYDVVKRVTGGSRIDVFSREAREGFAQYGNEVGKFGAAASK